MFATTADGRSIRRRAVTLISLVQVVFASNLISMKERPLSNVANLSRAREEVGNISTLGRC
jgi:hypothetical protein